MSEDAKPLIVIQCVKMKVIKYICLKKKSVGESGTCAAGDIFRLFPASSLTSPSQASLYGLKIDQILG